MNLNEGQILAGAEEQLKALFGEMPDFKDFKVLRGKRLDASGRATDSKIKVRLGKGNLNLWLETTAYGQPAKLREKAGELKAALKSDPKAKGVLCAPFISQDAAQVCADEKLGYVDLCGNCRMVFEGVYVVREGKANQFPERREIKTLTGLFSLRASRVLKVLLRRLDRPWKLQDAATKAEVSLSEAFKVARMLEEREFAGGRRGKFTLNKPEDLLKLWAEHYKPREHGRLQCYTMQSIKEFEERFAGSPEAENQLRGKIMYEQTRANALGMITAKTIALGKFSAAEYLAPHVNYSVATIYVEGDPSALAQQMELKPVEKGGNVELIEPVDPWFLTDRCGAFGRWVTSPVQTYLDLMQEPLRGPEAADAILKEFRTLTQRLWMGEGVSYD